MQHTEPLWNPIERFFVFDPSQPLLFNSEVFFAWFAVIYGLYLLVHKQVQLRVMLLLVFSLFFYYKSSGLFFLLLILSTVVNFFTGAWLHKASSATQRKLWMWFSVIFNLGLLGYYKYTNFVIDTINNLQGVVSFAHWPELTTLDIILPVGISFFTFQAMSYTIDIYRQKIKPINNLFEFGFFISFFPQLVAGPIVRASDFLPQIRKKISLSKVELSRALFLIMSGLVKKAVISDYISVNFVDRVFDNPALYSSFETWTAFYGYALQIYCDFSGYSDMAIGIALLFGFHLPDNFLAPYQSASITEFWRRWHISLSGWLRDYLYISLGGNRKGTFNTYRNLFLTMLLGGLWHGASWKFVLWGALHGTWLVIERLLKPVLEKIPVAFRKVPGILYTFHLVCFAWIFFRASSFELAVAFIQSMFGTFDLALAKEVVTAYPYVFGLLGLGFVLHAIPLKTDAAIQRLFGKLPLPVMAVVLAAIIIVVIQLSSSQVVPFIYFQF
ncbi:MAG: membrane-bound O-acyltransferase family protein [Crocinitomicaceae bacterium]|nr:membrane-bound O-acyltransferase family protein [Crocinitomicaceae bacterium]|tara:strand:- start:146 stop:1642 length:1497 start_codon:yes stop_codon:yes gene_type:complete